MTAPTLEGERAAPELLPCPFCGGKAELRKTPHMWMVECNNAECGSNPDALAVFKHDAIDAWNRRTAAPVAEDVALPPLDAELPPPVWGVVETVGDMVRNLLTLDQSLPIHAAFHVDIAGERRCRTRSVTISRERVIDGKWVDSRRKDVPYAIIVWAKQDERAYIDGRTVGTAPDEAKHIESEAVSAMLWLYRRLPRCYGRPPNVEQPIIAMAKLAGVEMNFVAESFSERAAAPSHSPAEDDK